MWEAECAVRVCLRVSLSAPLCKDLLGCLPEEKVSMVEIERNVARMRRTIEKA